MLSVHLICYTIAAKRSYAEDPTYSVIALIATKLRISNSNVQRTRSKPRRGNPCGLLSVHINRNEISRDLNGTQNTLRRAECWSSHVNINVGLISIRNSLSQCSGKTTTLACYCFSTILCSPMQNFVPRLARPSFARRQNSIKDHLRFQQVICYFTPSFRRQIDEQEQRRCRRRAAGFGAASAVAWKTYISVLRAKQQSAPSLPFSVPPSVASVPPSRPSSLVWTGETYIREGKGRAKRRRKNQLLWQQAAAELRAATKPSRPPPPCRAVVAAAVTRGV